MDKKIKETVNEYRRFIESDFYRYTDRTFGLIGFLKIYFTSPGFKFTFWLRTAKFLKLLHFYFPLYLLARFRLHVLKYRYGIDIPYNTEIDRGLYIGHFGGIVVSHKARLGMNVNINHGVTIGETFGGKSPGVPSIGDNVYLGPGSFIIGNITIGNNVAVGANTVVNNDVSDNGVIVNRAGEIISYHGSGDYIDNKSLTGQCTHSSR